MQSDRDSESVPTRTLLGLAFMGVLLTVCLAAQSRVWYCELGDWSPWSIDVWSPHNSQHFIDPYTISHFQHGLGMYLMLRLVFAKRLSLATILLIVATIEATWELVENTDMMINRYREGTVSLDYFGDSVINSSGDYLSCLAGAFAARRWNWRWTVTVLISCEILSVLWIRDSLLLNILMLTYPLDAVLQWQAPG